MTDKIQLTKTILEIKENSFICTLSMGDGVFLPHKAIADFFFYFFLSKHTVWHRKETNLLLRRLTGKHIIDYSQLNYIVPVLLRDLNFF